MKKITNRSPRLLLARNGLDFIFVGKVQEELEKATVGLKTMDEQLEATLQIHQRLDAYREDLSKILGWGELPTCETIAILLEGYDGISKDLIVNAKKEIDRLLRMESKPPIDIVAHVNKLFAECKGSHADKGKEMARKLEDDQWKAYKKARPGRPITQTIEEYFTQRSKDAAKPKSKATKKPK